MGLGPLSKAVEDIRARAAKDGETPPTDRERRRKEFESWLSSTKWREK
jgi:hypothetical protein